MENGLASWFRIWHPRYRDILIQLAVAAAIAAALLYFQQGLLDLLTLSLASGPAAAPAESVEHADKALAVLSNYAASLGLTAASLPLLVLGIFILVAVAASAIDYWKVRVTGRLSVRSEDDLEAEILAHLLRKDDAFFARHSPAETVNRLAVDVYRTTENRPNVMLAVASAALIVSSLGYFVQKDWRLAAVAFGGCVAGALWTFHMTKRVKDMDASYLRYDDRVKSHFEDCLRASPEIQVGDLHRKVRRHFEEVQEDRTQTYLRYVGLNAALSVGSTAWYLLAFIAMIFVALHLGRGGGNSSLALVPVVIWALPRLFNSASSLVFLNLQFQLARTSMQRLLEYEALAVASAGGAGAGARRRGNRPRGADPRRTRHLPLRSRRRHAAGRPVGGQRHVHARPVDGAGGRGRLGQVHPAPAAAPARQAARGRDLLRRPAASIAFRPAARRPPVHHAPVGGAAGCRDRREPAVRQVRGGRPDLARPDRCGPRSG